MGRYLLYTFFSFAGVLVHAQTVQRLCYSSLSRTVETGEFNRGMSLNVMPADVRRALANDASQGLMPVGYSEAESYRDPKNGLVAKILAPAQPNQPWIFVLSESANGDGSSAETLETLRFAFTECEYRDGAGQPLASHTWIMTGRGYAAELVLSLMLDIQDRRSLKNLAPAVIEFEGT